jgi:3-methyladenine DNA glycosylase AlkD
MKGSTNKTNHLTLTSKKFIERLGEFVSPLDIQKNQRYFREEGRDNQVFGVRFKTVFDTAKEFIHMPLHEIEKLLESRYYEVRVGAVSIMDFQARNKKTTDAVKEALYKLYIRRHDRINNWDLVDRSAPYVVGGYLFDKPRKVLYKLARSKNVWERRTAIVSTYYFIRQGDINDTFEIAKILVNDKHDLIQKATGSWIREAGKRDRVRLLEFLDEHAATMPRTTLRYAIEKLSQKQKEFYMSKAKMI